MKKTETKKRPTPPTVFTEEFKKKIISEYLESLGLLKPALLLAPKCSTELITIFLIFIQKIKLNLQSE